jgi:hypothetical protein
MNSPTWIESEKAISHWPVFKFDCVCVGWYKVLCSEKALVTRKKRKKRLTLLPLFYLYGCFVLILDNTGTNWRNE